jgi:hypothetical protein
MSAITTRGTGKDNHAAHTALETRRVVSQNENWTRLANAKQTHRRPDQYRPAYPVTSGRKKDYSAAVLGRLIESMLDGIGIVRFAITFTLYRDRSRIYRSRLQRGRRRERNCGEQHQRCEAHQHRFHPADLIRS